MTNSTTTRPGLGQRLTHTFLAGLLAALPLALTVAILAWLVEFIHRFLGPHSEFGGLLRAIGLKFAAHDLVAYLIGVLFTIGLIYLLGVAVQTGLRNRWSGLVDRAIDKVPVVGTIYGTLKKLTHLFETSDQSDLKSMSAVMCHFGGKGGTAVLALLPSSDKVRLASGDYYGVLIPTAPVPFGGAILYVPVAWVERVDIPFDDLLNIYMSMGATSAECLGDRSTAAAVDGGAKPTR